LFVYPLTYEYDSVFC